MKTGTGCKSPAVPATVSGESAVMKPLGISPEKATGTAMTRKPGDLPVVVVYRPARDCRTNGTSPHDGMSAL